MSDGPDAWSEIRLHPGGTCVCSSCSAVGGLLRWDYTADWSSRVDGSSVTIEVQDEARFSWSGPRQLVVKRWEGWYYLVPPAHVDWFDTNGPMHEFCFYRDGAFLFARPVHRRAN